MTTRILNSHEFKETVPINFYGLKEEYTLQTLMG